MQRHLTERLLGGAGFGQLSIETNNSGAAPSVARQALRVSAAQSVNGRKPKAQRKAINAESGIQNRGLSTFFQKLSQHLPFNEERGQLEFSITNIPHLDPRPPLRVSEDDDRRVAAIMITSTF